MTRAVTEVAFTPAVRKMQEANGCRAAYARMESSGSSGADYIGTAEAELLSAMDSFFIASVCETGWPYVQHRGGPEGFVRIINQSTIAFADFRGNRQNITAGNITTDDRVTLIFVDFAMQRRLKIWGRAKVTGLKDDPVLLESLRRVDHGATVESAMVITVFAIDWNCSQHIPSKYTMKQAFELMFSR